VIGAVVLNGLFYLETYAENGTREVTAKISFNMLEYVTTFAVLTACPYSFVPGVVLPYLAGEYSRNLLLKTNKKQ
jgi:hypothetical protein